MLFFTDHVLNPTLHGVVSPAQLYLPIIRRRRGDTGRRSGESSGRVGNNDERLIYYTCPINTRDYITRRWSRMTGPSHLRHGL